jgi:hypothetical protein
MGRTCRTHGGEKKFIQNFGGKARRKETTKPLGGRITLKLTVNKQDGVIRTGLMRLRIGNNGGFL